MGPHRRTRRGSGRDTSAASVEEVWGAVPNAEKVKSLGVRRLEGLGGGYVSKVEMDTSTSYSSKTIKNFKMKKLKAAAVVGGKRSFKIHRSVNT